MTEPVSSEFFPSGAEPQLISDLRRNLVEKFPQYEPIVDRIIFAFSQSGVGNQRRNQGRPSEDRRNATVYEAAMGFYWGLKISGEPHLPALTTDEKTSYVAALQQLTADQAAFTLFVELMNAYHHKVNAPLLSDERVREILDGLIGFATVSLEELRDFKLLDEYQDQFKGLFGGWD